MIEVVTLTKGDIERMMKDAAAEAVADLRREFDIQPRKEWLTCSEAAREWGCTESTIRNRASRQEIKTREIDGRVMYRARK